MARTVEEQSTLDGQNIDSASTTRTSTRNQPPDNIPPPPPPPPKLPPKHDSNSPYYLSSNDNPGTLISTIMFDGHNYDEWSKSLRLFLIARCKFEFIEGSVVKPLDGSLDKDWHRIQAMLIQWIKNTIEPSIRKQILYYEAAPLWAVLQRRFDVDSGTRKQQLKVAIGECKQTSTMSVADYFGKLQPLWDELATYDPIPSCTCGTCHCGLVELLQKRQDDDRLHEFLAGINPDVFGALRSSLLAQDPRPTLDRAYINPDVFGALRSKTLIQKYIEM